MHRTVRRWSVPVVLSLTLAFGVAPTAHAHPAPSFVRTGAGPTIDFHPRSGAFVYGNFNPPGPFSGDIGLLRRPNGFTFNVFMARLEGDVAVQFTAWSFHLPLGDASMGPHLHVAHIHSAKALGPFGRIDVTFISPHGVRQLATRCGPSMPDLSRRGRFSGAFDFTPHQGSLPDLHLTWMPAAIERIAAPRPCITRHASKPHCDAHRNVFVHDAAEGIEADVYFTPYGEQLSVSRSMHVGPAFEISTINAFPTTVATVKHLGLTFDTAGLSPVFSGSLTFHLLATHRTRGPLCELSTFKELWSSGTITANFDSGSVDLTGSGVRAYVATFARP
jgi:hypothetical protein